MRKLISICIATFNGEKYVVDQIASIVEALDQVQDWEWEIIVSDDQSTDNTVDKILSLGLGDRLKIVTGSQKGISKNFENAINHSSGEYIYFCDQDDVWDSKRISATIGELVEHDFVVCEAEVVDEYLQRVPKLSLNTFKAGALRNFCKNTLTGALLCGRRSAITKLIPFPANSLLHDQWIAVLAPFYSLRFCVVNCKLVYYRRHGDNASSTGEARMTLIKIMSNRFSLATHLFRNLIRK